MNRTCKTKGKGGGNETAAAEPARNSCGMLHITCEQNVQNKQEKGVEMKQLLLSSPKILDSKHYREAYKYIYSIACQTSKIGGGGYHAWCW